MIFLDIWLFFGSETVVYKQMFFPVTFGLYTFHSLKKKS